MSNDDNQNTEDEKYYKKIEDNNPWSNIYPESFPEEMADALVQNNKIPTHGMISTNELRKDLDRVNGIKDPLLQTEIIRHIRYHPQVDEPITQGGTYSPVTKDWEHYLKKKG